MCTNSECILGTSCIVREKSDVPQIRRKSYGARLDRMVATGRGQS
jgi:hypothetical protein